MTNKSVITITNQNINDLKTLSFGQKKLKFNDGVTCNIGPGYFSDMEHGSIIKWGLNMTSKILPGVITPNIEFLMLDEGYNHYIDEKTVPLTTALYIPVNNHHLVPPGRSRVWLWTNFTSFSHHEFITKSFSSDLDVRIDDIKISDIFGYSFMTSGTVHIIPCTRKTISIQKSIKCPDSHNNNIELKPKTNNVVNQLKYNELKPESNTNGVTKPKRKIDDDFIKELLILSEKRDEYIYSIVDQLRTELITIARSGNLHKGFVIEKLVDDDIITDISQHITTSYLKMKMVEISGKKCIQFTMNAQ